jgi:hypothetical protein
MQYNARMKIDGMSLSSHPLPPPSFSLFTKKKRKEEK